MKLLLMFFGLAAVGVGAAAVTNKPLEVVPHVELARYLGTWYEIATIPARFQKDCVAVAATYTLRPDGKIDVLNACRLLTLDGKRKSVRGKAWVVDRATNAKLKVQFFWPFRGDYWIIGLDSEYRWAVVGSPDRNYLWILARTGQMEERLYQELLLLIKEKGFDVSRLKRTLQPSPQ